MLTNKGRHSLEPERVVITVITNLWQLVKNKRANCARDCPKQKEECAHKLQS